MVNFITRSGNLLKNGATTFTYAGTNIYWLGILEQGPRYPTHTEIDDALATVVEMGGRVIRSQSLGMPVGIPLSIEPSQNVFNDAAFEPIDYTISQCAALGLRLIIPLCDGNSTYQGSVAVYAGWNGVATTAFFTNAGCISDFENRINHILTHVNQYSGVAIKDDPTIMLWETGNELENSGVSTPANTWTSTIAAYIKSIAPNALVADGFGGNGGRDLTSAQVALTGVDAYSLHYYGAPYATYASRISTATTTTNAASKVCYIGEWDWLTTTSGTATTMAGFCTTIETSSLSGDTFWSLFPHSDTSGYDLHNDGFSMYYPGATTDAYNRGQTLRTHAYTMSGVTKPAQETPTAPPFTSFSATNTDTALTWSGVVAARFYQLERSTTSGTGPWTVLSSTLPQDQGPYTDNGSTGGWYRVAGINGDAVKGAYSAVIGGTNTPPPGNGGDPRNPYGVTIASRATPLKNINPQVLADAVTLGLGWIRLQVRWIDIETSNGVFDFSVVDDCVARCMALGLKVQFPLQTPPPWRVLAGSCGPCTASGAQCIGGKWRPHDPTQTGMYADMLSKRYNGINTNNTQGKPLFIAAFEIGNEEMNNMNIPGQPDTYAAQSCKQAKWFIPVLQKCSPIIRANSPNALVGLPGLVKSGFGRAPFMQDLYNNNCINLFDYANIHTYPSASPNTPDNGVTLPSNIQEMVTVMDKNNDTGKDVWVTEIGWQVPSQTSEANRQLYYTQMLDDMRTSGRVGALNIFTMNYTDPTKNASSTEFSLTHLNAPQYTPTFGTFQTYIKKFPTWEDGSTTPATRDLHARFKLKTNAPVQVRDDVAARLLLRAPGVATQKIRDLSVRFRTRQVVGSGGVVKLPGQQFVNGVSTYIFGTNMSQDFATNTVRNTPVIQTQIAAGGFTVMRCNIPVSSTNAFIDQTANACNACGTQMLVILSESNATWNQSLVTYLGARCLMYEFGNEPDINGVTTAQYLAAWNSQIPALRALNSSAAFIGPALGVFSNVNSYLIPWLKGCVTSGNLPDGVSYHVYPCTASTCDQTCCTPKSGNFQTDAGTLRAAVQSVTSAPIALCLTEWNLDATNPPKAYTVANPFNTTWTEAALDSMVAGNLDLACQWDAAGNAGSGLDDLISTTSPFAAQVQYAPMVNRIAKYAPSMPLNDQSTRLHLRLSGTTQVIRDMRSRFRLKAVAVPTPATQDMGGRYRSRQIIKGGGGGGKPTQLMIVVMENRSFDEIFGSGKGNWPLTNALAAKYANATNFFGTFHPSLPNYIAILAGSRLGCNTDGAPGSSSCGPFANNTIVDSLESAGVSWKAYFENMPSVGYTGGDTNGYVQHHNPFIYFTSITNVAARKAKLVPLTAGSNANLIADLNAANPPRFVWVTPNIGDDGHTGGSPDTYITTLVSRVQQTNWYAAGGAIIVVWDEGEPKTLFSGIGDAAGPNNGGGPTGCFVVSAGAANFGLYTPSVNQYGMMKAACEILGVTQLVDEAHTINGDISPMFGTTGHSVAPIDFYTRFRLQFPGHIRDTHTRLHLTPGVTAVKIIADTSARVRLGAVSTTNSTKDTRARFSLRSATLHDTSARALISSNQTRATHDFASRVSFTFGSDTFNRANQSGWGVASDGETWVQTLGAATTSITNNTGQVTGTQGQAALMLLGTTTVADALAQVVFTYSSSTTDGATLILRVSPGATSYYRAFASNNTLFLSIINGTTTTNLASLPLSLVTVVPYTLKFLLSGQNLSAKIWQVGTPEPDWMLTTTDAALTGAGQYGIRTRIGSTGDLINYDNYVLTTSFAAQNKTQNVPTRFCLCNDGDTFTRPFDFFGAWGDSTSGSAWVQVGAFSVLNTTDTQGLLNTSTGDTYMLLGTEREVDVNCYADLTIAAVADTIGIFVRFQDTDNWYLVRYLNGKFDLVVAQDGVRTVIASLPTTMSLGVSYTVRIQAQGTLFSAKIWATGAAEPTAWTLRTTDATYDGIGQWGLYGNASSATDMRYDNFVAIALSRNVADDVLNRLVLQDFGVLDYSGRVVLLDSRTHDTRSRLVLGIVSTRDTATRLRFATIKGNDTASRVRLLAATQQQRFFASRMVLQDVKIRRVNLRALLQSPIQQRDTQQRIQIVGRPFLNTPVRVTIGVPRTTDMAGRCYLAIANPQDVQGRVFTVPSPLLDTSVRCTLAATSPINTATRIVVQNVNLRDVAQRITLAATRQRDASNRTRLASPAQTRDTSSRFQLTAPSVLPRTNDLVARLRIAIDQDTFTRANQSGWGTASGGSTWAHASGSTYTQSITGNEGQLTGATSNTYYSLGSDTAADVTVTVNFLTSSPADNNASVAGRGTGLSTYYRAAYNSGTPGHFALNKVVNNVSTVLITTAMTISANTSYTIKLRISGSFLYGKLWLTSTAEPAAWTLAATDTSLTGAGSFGVGCNAGVNTETAKFDSFVVTDSQLQLSTNDVATRLRMVAAPTQHTRDLAARLNLVIPSTQTRHDWAMRLPLAAVHTSNAATRSRLVSSHTSDTAARFIMHSGDIFDTPARLHYASLPVFKTMRVRAPLAAQNIYPLLQRIRLQPSFAKDAQARFLLTSQVLPVTLDLTSRINMALAQDTFDRLNQTGWGNSSDGYVWTQLAGVSTLSILSDEGLITSTTAQPGTNSVYLSSMLVLNVEALLRITPGQLTGDSGIFIGISNGGFRFLLNSGTLFRIDYVAPGGSPVTNQVSLSFPYTAHTAYRLRARLYNNNVLGKVWLDGTPEPTAWTAGFFNTNTVSAGRFGVKSLGSSSSATTFTFDNFVAYDARGLLETFDVPQRIHMVAVQPRSLVSRFQLTAIVNLTVALSDDALSPTDTQAWSVTTTGGGSLPTAETITTAGAYAATDASNLSDTSTVSETWVLADSLAAPLDTFARGMALSLSETLTGVDASTLTLAFASTDTATVPTETEATATTVLLTDVLTVAPEGLVDLIASTLGDTPLFLTEQSTVSTQAQSSDLSTVLEIITTSGVYAPSDALAPSDTAALGINVTGGDTLILLQESLTGVCAVAVSDSVSATDTLLDGLLQAETAQLALTEMVLYAGNVSAPDTSTPTELVAYLLTSTLLESLLSSDTLVIVAFSFMTGVDTLTQAESQTYLTTFLPSETVPLTESATASVLSMQQDALTALELLTVALLPLPVSEGVTSVESLIGTVLVGDSTQLGSIDALLVASAVTFASDVLVESSSVLLQSTVLLVESSAPVERAVFQLAEQLLDISITTDASTALGTLLGAEVALVASDSSTAILAVSNTDALSISEGSSSTVGVVAPIDNLLPIDVLSVLSLFSILPDMSAVLESGLFALALSSSDLLTTGEQERIQTLVQSLDALGTIEQTLMTLVQMETETTPVGLETGVFLNPSAIIGTDALILTERIVVTVSATTSDTLVAGEQTSYASGAFLIDIALSLLESATFLDVAFENVDVYLRAGTQVVTLRQGTIIAKRRDGSTTTIRR